MNAQAQVRSFAMKNMLLETDLDRIEERYQLDLGRQRDKASRIEEAYYPQFDSALRAEARRMAKHYELFYCLEASIRQMVVDVLEANDTEDWWEELVPEAVRQNVQRNIKQERESGVTPRSLERIDYTTFGELSEIIKSNWALFEGGVFTELKAVQKVMANLNSLRNPIAHCAALAEDEVVRLELSLRDWFRLMGGTERAS